MFPPSIHGSGDEYEWLITPDEADLVELPAGFVENLWRDLGYEYQPRDIVPSEYIKKLQAGVSEGGRADAACVLIGKRLSNLKNVFDDQSVDDVWLATQAWNKNNKPPLGDNELAETFKSILKRERSKQIAEETKGMLTEETAGEHGKSGDGDWRLTIVDSSPPQYKIFSPLWLTSTEEGCILVSVDAYRNPEGIARAALSQAQVWLNSSFKRYWLGGKDGKDGPIRPSLAKRLLENADHEEAPSESRREAVVGMYLYAKLAYAEDAIDGRPDESGRATRMADGSVWFQFDAVWDRAAMMADRITRNEVSSLLKYIGCDEKRRDVEGVRKKYKVCTEKSMRKLGYVAEINENDPLPSNLLDGGSTEPVGGIDFTGN